VNEITYFVDTLRGLIQNGTVDDQILEDLRTAPVTIYFAMLEKMNMSFSATKGHDYSRPGEHSIFFPYWAITNVEDFKFYFSLPYQKMLNTMLLNAVGCGLICSSDVDYYSMMGSSLCKDVNEWTKEDRNVFFNNTYKEANYKLLCVSIYINLIYTYIPVLFV
jgi:hypothetical protein